MSQDTTLFASFFIGHDLFGTNILQIREVIENPPYSPVPHSPDIVLGLMNLRGQIVTLIDTATSLGVETDPANPPRTCIILKTDEELSRVERSSFIEAVGGDAVGLLVDRMGEVVEVPNQNIDRSPANASAGQSAFILGVAKLDQQLMTLLCLQRVLEHE